MPAGLLRSMVMLRLPRLQQIRDVVAHPEAVEDRVLTLMTSAPRSASSCVPNGPATAKPRSSTTTPSSGERRSPSMRALTGTVPVGARIGEAARAASASARTSAVCSSGRAMERPGDDGQADSSIVRPTGADGADVGVVELGDAAVVEQRRVEQRVLGRADDLHRDADLGGEPLPVLGREPRHRRGHLVVERVQHDHVLGIGRDAHGRIARRLQSPPRGRARPAHPRRG